MDDTTQSTFRIPSSLYLKLRQQLLGEGKSVSAWVREQAERYTS